MKSDFWHLSYKPSTSVVQREIQQSVLNKKNKKEVGEVMDKKTRVFLTTSRLIVSSQVCTEGKGFEVASLGTTFATDRAPRLSRKTGSFYPIIFSPNYR